jgi:hypothetical protein
MSEFTQNITNPFPDNNMLFDASKVAAAGQAYQGNQLLLQGRQLDLSNANMEQVSRVSAALLNEPDPARRAELYPRYIGMLQSQGYAMHAPATLPDEATLKMLAAQGVSSEKQYEYGAGRTAAQGALGALGIGGNTGTTAAPSGGVATTPSATIEPTAFNNATAVRDGLIKRGMDPDTATGAAANALHESVANPRTGRGDNGNAAGIFMWTGPRLQAYIDKTGHPPDGAPLDEQLDFLMSEWKGSESAAAAKVAAAQGPAAKAAAFSQYFLRPKDTVGEMQRRSATALQLQQQIGGGTTTASAAPAGSGGTPGSYQVASTAPVPPPGSTAAPGGPTLPPAQTDTTQPPAATPAPAPQVPLEPMLQLMPSGLTAQQEAAAKVAFAQPMTPVQATALTAHYQTLAANNIATNHTAAQTNFERQRQAQNDALAQQEKAKADAIAAENLRLSQESGGRDTERLRLAQAEAAVKAKQAAQPYQGTDIGAQDTNVLMSADPKSKEYAVAYQRMAAPHYNQDGSVVYPNLSAFPKPGYMPPGANEPPDYGAPKVTPPTILTQDQARAGTYADRMVESNAIMSKLDSAALDYVQKGLSKVGGVIGFGMNSADYQRVKQAQENFVNSALRLESGAVISEDEFKKASQQYFPQPGDSAAVIAQKKANREAEISGFVREAGPGYKPKAPEAAVLPTVKSADDYAAIKPGEQYRDPGGNIRRKP